MNLKSFTSAKRTLEPRAKVGKKVSENLALPSPFVVHSISGSPRSASVQIEFSKHSHDRYTMTFPRASSLEARARAANAFIRSSARARQELLRQLDSSHSW